MHLRTIADSARITAHSTNQVINLVNSTLAMNSSEQAHVTSFATVGLKIQGDWLSICRLLHFPTDKDGVSRHFFRLGSCPQTARQRANPENHSSFKYKSTCLLAPEKYQLKRDFGEFKEQNSSTVWQGPVPIRPLDDFIGSVQRKRNAPVVWLGASILQPSSGAKRASSSSPRPSFITPEKDKREEPQLHGLTLSMNHQRKTLMKRMLGCSLVMPSLRRHIAQLMPSLPIPERS